MQIVLYEWKKIFINQRGWLVILVALMLKMGYLLIVDTPEYVEVEQYRNDYMYYMQNVNGKLSDEKTHYIEAIASQSAAVKDIISQTYLDFYAGNISEKECNLKVEELSGIAKRSQGMNALYEQYLYVRQQPENRYMMYPNGWAALLQEDELDFFFLTALLILIIQLVCNEYVCKMDCLVLTTLKGSKNFGIKKELMALFLALALNLFFNIEHFIFCEVKYGLSDAGYPIQSLECFSECPYSINLGQAFLALMVLRMFGSIFLATLVCFVATWTRKYAVSCLLVLCIVVIPYIALNDSLQYRLPLPLGFLRAVGYFFGNEVVLDSVTGKETTVFFQITQLQLIGICIISFLEIFMCCIYIWYKSRNKVLCLKGKNYVLLFIGISSISLLTGCGSVDTLQEVNMPYNSISSDFYQDNECLVKTTRNEENVEVWMQGENDELVNIIRSPFGTEFINQDCIYCLERNIYYMSSYTEDDSNIRLYNRAGKTTMYILEVLMDSMEENCIFEVSYQKNSEWSFLNNVRAFFLNKQNIWFITENTIWQVDLFTYKKEMLNIPVAGNIAYDGQRIYFVDDTMRLSYYDIQTGLIDVIDDIATKDYVLTQKGIYFSNLRDNHYLYFRSADRNITQLIAAEEITSIGIEGVLLKYYAFGDTNVHTMKLE